MADGKDLIRGELTGKIGGHRIEIYMGERVHRFRYSHEAAAEFYVAKVGSIHKVYGATVAAPPDGTVPATAVRKGKSVPPVGAPRSGGASTQRRAGRRVRAGRHERAEEGLVVATPDNVGALLGLQNPPRCVWWEKAEMELCLVPAGEFVMGTAEGLGEPDEHPQRRVRLDAYYIGRAPVTETQYARFVQAADYEPIQQHHGHEWTERYSRDRERKTPPPGRGDHPVSLVSWDDAVAYCQWAGLRLPTEAEWEKAARGTDGREYPWGDREPTHRLCNFGQNEGRTTPVGNYSPQGCSPYGCCDMAGNVWEWVADRYDDPYYSRSPSENPNGPSSGHTRVQRGGSWADGPYAARSAYRGCFHSDLARLVDGFRCAIGPT